MKHTELPKDHAARLVAVVEYELEAEDIAELRDRARWLRGDKPFGTPPQGVDSEYDAGPSKADMEKLADKYERYANSWLGVD